MNANIEMVLLEDAVESRTHDPWRRGQFKLSGLDNNGVDMDVDADAPAIIRRPYQPSSGYATKVLPRSDPLPETSKEQTRAQDWLDKPVRLRVPVVS